MVKNDNTTFAALFLYFGHSKKILIMGLFYSILTSILLSLGINGEVPYGSIERAFVSNNPTEIVSIGKAKILMNVLGKEGIYSQSQASLVLKDFFTKKPNGSFNFFFKGKESSEGTFAIGSYTSRSEEFRVTIHFKNIDGQFKIESLTIENA